MNPLSGRLRELDVARILTAIGAPPNWRTEPMPGDLTGAYDAWFDGGAVQIGTGVTRYCFADGTVALTSAAMPTLSINIRFPDGRTIAIEQD